MQRHIHARVAGDERGAVGAFVAVGMLVMVGIVALAIDLGMLMTARGEAQRTADGSALAGAASLIYDPNDEVQARQWAKDWAAKNPVRKQTIALRDEDIDVLLSERKVRVRVLRTETHGGAISTLFARMFGIDAVSVSAFAAAEASVEGAGTECMFPVAIPDRWWNGDSNLEFDQPPDVYYPPSADCSDPALWTEWCNLSPDQQDVVGYRVGEELTFKPSQGGQGGGGGGDPPSTRLEPGFWDLWLPEGNSGVPPIRERVWNCVEEDPAYYAGDEMYREAGNKQTVSQEFEDLIEAYDEHLVWEGSCTGIVDAPCSDPTAGFHIEDSLGNEIYDSHRYRPAPMFDPRYYTQQGSGPHFTISQIMAVFINRVDPGPPGQRNVYAVLLPWLGSMGDGDTSGPEVKALRLVE